MDTERGICEWWLRDAWPPFHVHTAIERLVAVGEMAARSLPDGQRAYALSSSLTQVPGLRPPAQP